jgi:hypothetical protein
MPNPQAINVGQVTVAATATLIARGRPDRRAITIEVKGASPQAVYIGGDATVLTTTGIPIPAIEGASITIPGGSPIYGIVAATTQDVCFIETYN